MRKSLSGKSPGPSGKSPGKIPRLSGDKGPGNKNMKNIAIATAIGVVIVLVIVVGALALLNRGPSAAATPTPAPTATPTATIRPTVTPTPAPTVAPTPTAIPTGRVYYISDMSSLEMSALLNGNTGQLIIGVTVATAGQPVNVSNLTISIVCNGQTYSNVWTISKKDWDLGSYDDKNMLRPGVNVATTIDTKALGIPQGKPMTVKFTRNGDPYGEVTLAPTY